MFFSEFQHLCQFWTNFDWLIFLLIMNLLFLLLPNNLIVWQTVNFTLVVTRYFYIPINILELFSGVQLSCLKIYLFFFRSYFKDLKGMSGVVLTQGLIILCCGGKTLLYTLPKALWILRFAGNDIWLCVGLGYCCFLLFPMFISPVVFLHACAYQHSAAYRRIYFYRYSWFRLCAALSSLGRCPMDSSCHGLPRPSALSYISLSWSLETLSIE